MESWSYVSGGKGFISNEISSSETFGRNKMPWWAGDSKPPRSFNNYILEGQASDNQVLGESGYRDLVGKELIESPIKILNPFAPTLAAFISEDESTSRLSSSIVDSNSRESSLIDLKLGRFGDLRDVQNSTFSGAVPIGFSKSSVPPKRMRMGANLHAAYCQVHDCNKDLSSLKEYHKRHKVCEVHSKTAKVIVNGVEQRFCQQCSRFHLLSEFDDGKRSCRKRLADHNERRRKPQFGFHSGRTGKLIKSYNGPCAGFETGRFHGSTHIVTSFICPDILPSSLLHPETSEANDWCGQVKPEDRPHFRPLSIPISTRNLPSKLFPSSNFEKVFPPYQDNAANNASVFSESNNQLLLDMGAAINPGSCHLLQDSSLRDDNFPTFDAASTIQGFSGITESGCALSLLSPQSHNSSSHLSGFPLARPMIVPGSIAQYNTPQFSEKLIGVNYQNSTTGGLPNKFPSPGNSAEGSYLCPILTADASGTMNFDVSDRLYQGSRFGNDKDNLYCEDGATIDLLQLSSQLQRVECEKQSIQVKHETDVFCCTGIT